MTSFYPLLKTLATKVVLLLFTFTALFAINAKAQTTIWTENFTGGAIPAGWSTNNLGLGSNWAFNTTAAYNSDGTPAGHVRVGQNLLFATDAVITTANVAMTAGRTYKLQFKVRTNAASGQNIPLEVRVGTGTGTLANYPTVVHSSTQNGTSFTTITTSDFTCLLTANYKFAFRAQVASGFTTRTIGIDNVIAIENPPLPMAFASCTVAQASTAAVDRGSSNNAILNLQIVTTGTASPLTCSSITFNTTGTPVPANLTNAQLYYTGNTATFSTGTPFGSAYPNPNGGYTVTPGTAVTLAGGTNHFWLAYDIDPNAPVGNVVDGQITLCNVGGTDRTPTATNPAGTRTILNDGPCGAVALTANLTCTNVTQTNTGSATSSGITLSSCGGAAGDVWYSFTPSTTSSYTVTVARLGAYDPVLQAFSSTGTCPSLTLTNISCSDAISAGTAEVITFTGTSGITYYFRVTDYNSVTQADGFNICLTQAPANDVCSGSTTLSINGSAIAGANSTASAESPLPTTTGCGSYPPTATDKGLWYTFTTTCAGNYTVSAVPTGSFDVEMAAFTGACGSTTGAGCGVAQGGGGTESITIISAPANTVYRVLVWGYNAAVGTFDISLTGPPASLVLSNAGTPAAGSIPAGGTSQLLHGFTLTPACGSTTYNLTSVTVNNSGTASASDFSTNAKLYYDADNSGTVNGGDVLITSTPVSSVLTFNISTQTGISGTRQYIIVADVAITAVGGNTFIASSTAANASIAVNAGTTNGNTRTITPFNDNCAGAFAFGTLSTSGCTSQTVVTTGATQTFAGCVGTADDDVWFSFTMPAGYTSIAYSNINISGNTDRVLQFYSGTCGSLTPISPTSCFDPESGTVTGFVGGQTYYVRAYTSANAVNSTFTLCLTVPPVNDNCAGVIAFPTLAPGCTNVNGNTLGATNSGVATCSGTADDDVWFSFVMPAGYTSVAYSFSNISGDNNRVIQFFNSSCGVGPFSCQTTPTGSLSGLTAGNTYWLRVYTSAATPAYSEFTLCLALPPTNDDCAGALPIPSSGALQPGCNTVTASTAASTATTGVTPAPCTGTADDDVWYKFVISSTTNVGYSITDISGNNDRIIQVFDACGGSQVYCNTAEAGLLGSLTAGTYYVRVFTAGTGVISDFDLCISLPPANDVPCNAIALASPDDACLPTAGTTQLATASQGTNGVPAACSGTAEDDVWYSFVATSTTHTVTVTGSSGFNAAFELYTRSGSCPSATFTAVASSCTNNIATLGSAESLTIRGLTIGTTYFVRVYDAGASVPTTPGFTICVVENPTGIPITYYDFELNSNRNGFFETTPEVSVNTAASFTSLQALFQAMGVQHFLWVYPE
ncbi:MAG: choice-of-anchor J domain-containing protein [Sphingobacteriales bacterium JAD_PAG50586_3]|nr:MAG: choice-of-anchor J domain-containing protein [Sphingobacteriales bacterium JAD_PAG50586_3]